MRYVITIHPDIPVERREEYLELIPKENAYIMKQRALGIIEAIYLSSDTSHAWIVMHADSPEAAQRQLLEFPFYEFFSDMSYTELA